MRLLYIMQLFDIGKIVANEWMKITETRHNIKI